MIPELEAIHNERLNYPAFKRYLVSYIKDDKKCINVINTNVTKMMIENTLKSISPNYFRFRLCEQQFDINLNNEFINNMLYHGE